MSSLTELGIGAALTLAVLSCVFTFLLRFRPPASKQDPAVQVTQTAQTDTGRFTAVQLPPCGAHPDIVHRIDSIEQRLDKRLDQLEERLGARFDKLEDRIEVLSRGRIAS